MTGQFNPGLRASGTIRAFRIVMHDATSDNNCVEANAASDKLLGITSGTTKDPLTSTAVHAEDGDMVQLQLIGVMQVEAAAAVTAGDYLMSDADGKATPVTTGERATIGIALEAAADAGEVIRILWQPHEITVA